MSFSLENLLKRYVYFTTFGPFISKIWPFEYEKMLNDMSNPKKYHLFHSFLACLFYLLLQNIGGRYSFFSQLSGFQVSCNIMTFITLWHELPTLENLHYLHVMSYFGVFYPHLTLTSFLLENGLQTTLHYFNITNLIQIQQHKYFKCLK